MHHEASRAEPHLDLGSCGLVALHGAVVAHRGNQHHIDVEVAERRLAHVAEIKANGDADPGAFRGKDTYAITRSDVFRAPIIIRVRGDLVVDQALLSISVIDPGPVHDPVVTCLVPAPWNQNLGRFELISDVALADEVDDPLTQIRVNGISSGQTTAMQFSCSA